MAEGGGDASATRPKKKTGGPTNRHVNCLRHGKKNQSVFEHIMNRCRAGLLPIPELKKVARAVCICDNRAGAATPEEDVKAIQKYFRKTLKKEPCRFDEKIKKDIDKIATGLTSDHVSQYRLLKVLQEAEQGSFSSLNKFAQKVIGKPIPVETPSQNQQNPVAAGDPVEIKYELKIQPNWLGMLIGKKGKYLKVIQEKHGKKNCEIKIEELPSGRLGWMQMDGVEQNMEVDGAAADDDDKPETLKNYKEVTKTFIIKGSNQGVVDDAIKQLEARKKIVIETQERHKGYLKEREVKQKAWFEAHKRELKEEREKEKEEAKKSKQEENMDH